MESIWLVNGKPGGLDPRDRGLAYGDGLFETMACRSGSIRWIDYHLDRLAHGCGRLSIPLPGRDALRDEIESACPPSGSVVVKLIVTRGVGERGYRAPEPALPTRILSITSWPEHSAEHYTQGISVRTCVLRLGENPQLAGLKHLCRLEQVLAQMELTGTDAHEGLLRNSSGLVVGGISSNVFAVQGDRLLTPQLTRCGVRGVMRRVVLEHARAVGLEPVEADIHPQGLLDSDEVFLTNAVLGVRPVREIDSHSLAIGPKAAQLMQVLGNSGA